MNSKFLLIMIIGISITAVSITVLLGFYPQFDFDDNSGPMPISIVPEKYPDSCSYEMILHLEQNSNMASDANADDFGLGVNNMPENVDTESWHKCLIELDSMIIRQKTEMSEKISEVLGIACEEMTIQGEWSDPDEYTRAYDVRFSQCKPLNDILHDCEFGRDHNESRTHSNNTHTINNTDCEWKIHPNNFELKINQSNFSIGDSPIISGFEPEKEFIRIIVFHGDEQMTNQKIQIIDDGFFEYDFKIQSNWPNGQYYAFVEGTHLDTRIYFNVVEP